MFRNYVRIALKNLSKQKLFSLINILGLTVGITCCLMIFLYVQNEFSFDNFHKNGRDIYRVVRVGQVNGGSMEVPYLSPPYATALLNDYPDQIKAAVRVMPDNDLVSYNNISFNEKNIYLTDENFFTLFDFHLQKGDPATVLKEPGSIVLTAASAKKYFGSADPIGKVVMLNNKMQLKVTGIADNVPSNSHLNFDMIVPLSNFRNAQWFTFWPNNNMFVYLQLAPNTDPAKLKRRFPEFMDKYMGKFYKENGFKMDLSINPLSSIYFEPASVFDNVKHGNKKMVYIFMSVAILILVIACINFINLATARAADRSREVGLRKVLGALRKQLVWQFILESVCLSILATCLALLLLQVMMPAFKSLIGHDLPPYFNSPLFYVVILTIVAIAGLLAGSYPAFLLSSFTPIDSLKGKMKVGRNSVFFRKALVVFQFGVSVLLIICITVVIGQMQFLHSNDLGFSKDQSLIVQLDNHDIWENKTSFKNQLLRLPSVENVSLMSGEPGGFHDSYSFEVEARPGDKIIMNTEFADFDYVKTLRLKIIAGRDFSGQFPTDTLQAAVINRTAAKALGYTPEQAIGKWVRNVSGDSLRRNIVGVVEDFHYSSFKNAIGPLVICNRDDKRLALIKLHTANMTEAINSIKHLYTSAAPSYPFEYDFLDQRFDNLYKTESAQQKILSLFSAVAIFIACLGLFGLASYTAVKRTKEIGVRKVLGSSIRNIIFLLSKDLLKPVLLGTFLAIPTGYYVTHKWLEGFVYRINIHWWMFAIAALTGLAIAMVTVSFQAVKAAIANPVVSLRAE